MDERPRLVVIGPVPTALSEPLAGALGGAGVDVVAVPDAAAALDALRAGPIAAVLADPDTVLGGLAAYRRDEIVLAHLDKGVGVLDPSGVVTYANAAMRQLAPDGAEPVGRTLMHALGATTLASDTPDPFQTARHGLPVSFRVYRPGSQDRPYLDVDLRPVVTAAGVVEQQVVIVRNVTPEVEQQRKLDALHAAGRDLADLDPAQLAEMNVPTRVELLKQNLRRYIHDLLHYDIIEVRLLDSRTGELTPLLEDGMTPTAARRTLYAREDGNGVTGYVAATGESYLCRDTANDPLYLQGATDARSSMTVALKYHDEVVGTLNVESPKLNGFGADDLQFTELFSKEIAAALHTLDLLSAQQTCTASQSLDLINREVALPVDDVLANAAALLHALGESDPASAARLRRILASARAVKDSIRKVGRDLNADDPRAEQPLSGKRVLVLESDERLRRAAHLLLNQLGASAETVGTAAEAEALAGTCGFDAILQDIRPPDRGGYDTYRSLRAACPGAVVVMTTGFGYDSAHSIVKARGDGMQTVLFKPYQQSQVVKAVLGVTAPSPAPVVRGLPV